MFVYFVTIVSLAPKTLPAEPASWPACAGMLALCSQGPALGLMLCHPYLEILNTF